MFNKENFYKKTMAEWSYVEKPNREPDFISGELSEYWFNDEGVFRFSDHWGKVGSCIWDTTEQLSFALNVVDDYQCGFCEWKDFEQNTITELDLDFFLKEPEIGEIIVLQNVEDGTKFNAVVIYVDSCSVTLKKILNESLETVEAAN